MKKTQIHQFDPIIYPFKLWVAITKNGEALKERFQDGYNNKDIRIEMIDKNEAVTFLVQQKEVPTYWGALIVFSERKYCSVKNMAHEATHAARFYWEHMNEETTGWEADAYLVGWIAKCIEETKNYKNGQAS